MSVLGSRLALALALLVVECPGSATAPDDDDDDATPQEEIEPLPVLYEDVTEAWGVDYLVEPPDEAPTLLPAIKMGGGSALADLDGDGLLDLLLTSPFRPAALHRNAGDTFERIGSPALEAVEEAYGVTVADLDDDGLLDLLITAGRQVRVFANRGGMEFEEQPPLLETADGIRPITTAVADADGDGALDVFVATWGVSPDMIFQPAHGDDRLFEASGPFTFEERVDCLPDVDGLSDVASWIDIDDDGDLDLYVAKDFGHELRPNALFVQGEDGVFEERAADFGMDLRFNSMGLDFGDVDGDGETEFVVGDTGSRLQLWSLLDGFALDVSQSWHAWPADSIAHQDSWGGLFEDVDNDGDLDLVVPWGHKEYVVPLDGQYCSLWLWGDDGDYHDVTAETLPAIPSPAWRTVLTGDIDGDGSLDLVWTSQVGPVSVQLGRPTGYRWLAVELETGAGLGARVEVDGVERLIQGGGRGLLSSMGPIAWFGLGSRSRAEQVRVRWPDGSVTELQDVAANQRIVVAPKD
jgi:enediyne biosynthesis protein E4